MSVINQKLLFFQQLKNESIFTSNIPHSEFVDYSLVRQSEIEYLKNNSNLLVEKEILDSQSMYGNKDKIVTKPSE